MIGPNLSEIAVRERSLTLFILLALAGAGLFAFFQIGRAEDPAITIRKMIVTVAWPGATAEEIQDQVADKLEKRLQELEYFDNVETTTRPGVSVMQVSILGRTPTDQIAEQWYQVRKKLTDERANLPRGVLGPSFNDEYSDVYFSLVALQARNMPERELVRDAERLRNRLLDVPGVGKVNILGEQPRRIFVEFAPERLSALGITPQQLITSLEGFNAVTPAGIVETAGPRIAVRLDASLADADVIRDTPVAASGRTLKIRDIAEVRQGYEDPPSYRVRHQGAQALMLGVVMKHHYNGSLLGKNLNRALGAIAADLPLGLELTQVFDQSRIINDEFEEFMLKFAAAIVVVMLVTFATLTLRVGLVVAAAVPLTLSGVFGIMLLTGKDFDNITLGALILSLGLLVDDAIIAIEMMVLKIEEGLDRIAAATFAWHSTAAPMLSGTLVTAIGFLPIGIAKSTSGEYAGNIFWITAAALLVSWLVAVFFTPYLGLMLLPSKLGGDSRNLDDFVSRRRADLSRLVRWCIDNKRRVLGLTAFAFVSSVFVLAVLPKQFYPISDRTELLVEVSLPRGSSMSATTGVVAGIERYLMRQPEARYVDSYLGAGAPRFFLSLNPEMPDPSFAKIVVQTDSPSARIALRRRLTETAANGAFPAARVRATELLFGPPVPFPVTFRVSGPDTARVREISARLRDIMEQTPGTRDVHFNWGERAPALRLTFDNERLLAIGLTPADVGRQIGALVSGIPVTQARIGDRTVDVVIRARSGGPLDAADLGELPIATMAGARVTLAQVARIEPTFEEPVLIRRNRRPTISVVSDLRGGKEASDVTRAVESRMAALTDGLPEDYRIETGGSVEESTIARASLVAGFPVMLLLMLVIIMLQVRSLRLAALVFATAPLGLIGAVTGLALTGYPFGFTAILGLIGLAGILMRNTLILVDQIGADQAAGRSPYQAVTEATVRRARPVILAALATLLAFIPLAFSSFWGPMAVVLIGGLAAGTALTLLTVPALYAVWFGVTAETPNDSPALKPSVR